MLVLMLIVAATLGWTGTQPQPRSCRGARAVRSRNRAVVGRVAGVRQDVGPGPERGYLVLNVGTSLPTARTEVPRSRDELQEGSLVPMSRLQRGSGTVDPCSRCHAQSAIRQRDGLRQRRSATPRITRMPRRARRTLGRARPHQLAMSRCASRPPRSTDNTHLGLSAGQAGPPPPGQPSRAHQQDRHRSSAERPP